MRLDEDIAIVGISVFTPAGSSVGEFWDGISQGKDFITEAPNDVIERYYFKGEPNGVDRFYTSRGGFTPPFKVEPIRYGIMPLIADATDPEQLMSLVGVEQALKDAGVFEKNISLRNGSIIIGKGNFSGPVALRVLEIVRMSHQFINLLKMALPELTEEDLEVLKEAYQKKHGRYHTDMATGTMPNLVASMVANRFDMYGPAYTIDGACASGILAIDHSINLLRSGKSDIAIAGGMHAGHSPMFWGVFDLLGAMSKKQEISPFSEDADGLIAGQGYGFIVLKKLSKAIEDGDRIYATIKDTAVGSDGLSSHVMVTSTEGQVRALDEAWRKSGLNPKDVAYVEAHGTGTVAGDRTEIETLKRFFGDSTHRKAYVGSVKSNIGHLMPAAGMLGVIKTALSLYHRKIPPTLHCEKPIPGMFESRFMPPQEAIDWNGEELPLLAGVNAFGFGGINAHAILTAYEPEGPHRPKPYLGEAYLLSAKSKELLIEKLNKGDFTNTGGNYRLAIIDPSEKKLKQAISIVEKGKAWRGKADIWFTNEPLFEQGGKVVAMLPGFDFRSNPDFDDLSDSLGLPRISDLLKDHETEVAAAGKPELMQAWEAHYARLLSKQALEKLGVEADMYVGHSSGEWDAILFAEMVDSIPESLKEKIVDVAHREGQSYPITIVSHVDRNLIDKWCAEIPNLFLVADNCPSQIMLCGDQTAMNTLIDILKKEGVFHTPPIDGIGMHTPFAKNLVETCLEEARAIQIKESPKPVWSASTLEPIPTHKEKFTKLVFEQLMKPLYFRELIEKLYTEEGVRIFIQLGLGSLTSFVEDTLKDQAFGAIETNTELRSAAQQFRRIAALLFVEGRSVDSDFIGVNPTYQVDQSVMTLVRGLQPVMKEFPELDEIIAKRYGDTGIAFGKVKNLSQDLNHPIAAFADENLRTAVDVQRELVQLFEQATMRTADATVPDVQVVATSSTRAGTKFEEILSLHFNDHQYLIDHAIIRQPDYWKITEDLDPVIPFTMTMELFGEIALKHAPDQKLIKLQNVQAFKWISLVKPLDITVKCHWLEENILEVEFVDLAKGECVLGDAYLEPHAEIVGDFSIGKKLGTGSTVELYDRFQFHGPLYRSAISEYTEIYERGLKVTAEKQPGKGSLLDVMGQQIGNYLHLTQTKDTISFPVRLKELIFFDDFLKQDGIFDHTLKIARLSDYLIHGDAVLEKDGKPWAVAHDFVCQRFRNIPVVWSVMLTPHKHTLSEEIAPGVYHYYVENPKSQNNVLLILSKRYFGVEDRAESVGLTTSEAMQQHLISRVAVKDAARAFAAKQAGSEMVYPIEFYCTHDENGKPLVRGHGDVAKQIDHVEVSLSHKDFRGVGIASDKPVGIDLEKIEEKSDSFIKLAYTDGEIALLKQLGDTPEAVIRFWVAKEASAKKTGLGFGGNPKAFEVTKVDGDVLTVNGDQVKTMKIDETYIVGWTI